MTSASTDGAVLAPESERYAFIDTLRGIAIVSVFFHHLPGQLGAPFGALYERGGRGVDLFFVLSGFLIGSTALSRAGEGRFSRGADHFKSYWILRTARILPLYLVLLALLASGLPAFHPEAAAVLRRFPFYYLCFGANYLPQATLELGILWSLSIEEQFYLVVGLLILMHGQRRERLAAAFTGVGTVVILGALLCRYDLLILRRTGVLDASMFICRLHFGTLARMDQLGFGLLTAVVAMRWRGSDSNDRRARATSWMALFVAVVFMFAMKHRNVYGFTILGFVFSACILWLQRPAARRTSFGAIERAIVGPLGYLGRLSFGLYLLHPLTRFWLEPLLARPLAGFALATKASVFVSCWLLVTTLLAAVSFATFERPVLAWARRRALGTRPRAVDASRSDELVAAPPADPTEA